MIRGWRAGIGFLLCLVIATGSAGAIGYSDDGAGGKGIGYDGAGGAAAGVAADARPSGFSPSPSAGRRGGGSFGCTPSPGTSTPTPVPFPTPAPPPTLLIPEIPTINLPAPTINFMDLLTPAPAR